jgi:hypothetical protein
MIYYEGDELPDRDPTPPDDPPDRDRYGIDAVMDVLGCDTAMARDVVRAMEAARYQPGSADFEGHAWRAFRLIRRDRDPLWDLTVTLPTEAHRELDL